MLLQENKSHQLIFWSSVYYKWSRKPAVFGGIKLQVFFSFFFDQVKLDSGYTSLPSLVQQIWRRSGIYAWLSPTNKLTYTLWKPDKNNNIQILAAMNRCSSSKKRLSNLYLGNRSRCEVFIVNVRLDLLDITVWYVVLQTTCNRNIEFNVNVI